MTLDLLNTRQKVTTEGCNVQQWRKTQPWIEEMMKGGGGRSGNNLRDVYLTDLSLPEEPPHWPVNTLHLHFKQRPAAFLLENTPFTADTRRWAAARSLFWKAREGKTCLKVNWPLALQRVSDYEEKVTAVVSKKGLRGHRRSLIMSVGKCWAGSEKWWGSRRGRDMRSGRWAGGECWVRGPLGFVLTHETPQANKILHPGTSRLLFQKTYIYPTTKQVTSLNSLQPGKDSFVSQSQKAQWKPREMGRREERAAERELGCSPPG